MDLEIKKWLKDIELAISEINSFFPEKKVFSEFQNDVKSKKAAEVIWSYSFTACRYIFINRHARTIGLDSVEL